LTSTDYTKDLQEEIARYALPNPYRHKRRWRLFFVSSDGRMVQSANYRRVVTATLTLLLLLVSALAVTTSLWLHTRRLAVEATLQQRELQATLSQQTTEQERLMARLALAEGKISTGPVETARELPAVVAPEAPPASTPFVRAEELEPLRSEDETSLKITFKLFNDTPNKTMANGTLFLVFPPKEGSTHAPRCLPAVLLKNGVPSDPSRGERFQMRNFSSHTFRLHTDAGALPHTEVILYAFDESSTLRYTKTFSL
jgi:hypothetical protein